VLGDFDAEKVCDEPNHNALDGLEIGPIAQRQLALIDVMVECTANKAVGTHEQEDGQDCAYHQTHSEVLGVRAGRSEGRIYRSTPQRATMAIRDSLKVVWAEKRK